MKYAHRFQVIAPLAAVAAFHQQAASMAAITPPPVLVVMHETPTNLAGGGEMEFTLWLGPLPIRWRARIEQVSPRGFVDRQLHGPFRAWQHRHTFVPLQEGRTEVLDEIEVELANAWLWRLLGLGMWLNMPILFAYRGWRTRRLLERQSHSSQVSHS